MNLEEYLDKNKEIYQNILEFLDSEENSENIFEDLKDIFFNQAIQEKKEDLNTLFHLLLSISNNHHRSSNFFTKIERILTLFKTEISQFFKKYEIFSIFKSNKRILLYLIKEKVITIDRTIANTLSNGWYKRAKYHFYFYPEMKKFFKLKSHEKMIRKTNEMNEVNSKDFEQNRMNGENNKLICKLIKNDEIDDFIVYVNKTNFSLSNMIEPSIFETNFALVDKKISLIDYATFYGSIQIFRYLYMNEAIVSPDTWIYAVHSRKPEMIHLLEEYLIEPKDKSFLQCFNESIKCHHNEIASYFQNNQLENNEDKSISIKYYNFEFFPKEEINKIGFYFACKYNNLFVAKYFLENSKSFDINEVFTDGDIQHTALTAATKERNKEIVELLLAIPSIDVNIKSIFIHDKLHKHVDRTEKDKSPLHIAVEEGDEEIVKLLLQNTNIDVNNQLQYIGLGSTLINHIEKTALNIAVEKENVKIVTLLLQHPDIDVNKKSKHNDCCSISSGFHDRYIEKIALIIAVERENLKIVSLLLNHPKIDVNIISRYHDYIYGLIDGYRGNQYMSRTALQIAIEKNNIDIVQLLLKQSKIEVNYRMFFYKCNYKFENEDNYKTDHYVYLDDGDGDVNDDIKLSKLDRFQIDDNLLNFNEIEFDGCSSKPFVKKEISPLFIAVSERNVDITSILLDRADIEVNYLSFIDEKNIDENRSKVLTPLAKAIDDKSSQIIHLLKSHGAI